LSGEMVRRSSILSLNDCKYPTHNDTHRHFTNVLSLFTVLDIVCQLNDIEFTVDLFVDDDVNNDAIFKRRAFPLPATNKYVNTETRFTPPTPFQNSTYQLTKTKTSFNWV